MVDARSGHHSLTNTLSLEVREHSAGVHIFKSLSLPPVNGSLSGKCALVTGGSRGLGSGIARELAACGAKVAVNYIHSEAEARSVVEAIGAAGGRAIAVQGDVSKSEEVQSLFAQVERMLGPVNILVNNAGSSMSQNIFETSEDDWQQIIDVNLKSAFLCSKLAMESMRATGQGGHIINISSIVAHQGALAGHVHYAASKSGSLGMTRTLARTGAPLNIRVNAVAPGIIDTELLRKTHGAEGVAKLTASVPLGIGTVEDVAYAVSFLCGPGGRYITGAVLDVNGGLYMR